MTLDQIPIFCISMPGERKTACSKLLTSQGIDFKFVDGFDGARSGLSTQFSYQVDHPTIEYHLTPRQIGIYLSHWNLWNGFQLALTNGWTNAPAFMVLEDDASFLPDWREKVSEALVTLGDDWDYLAPGNCDCGPPNPLVRLNSTDLYETRPLCTHCYVINTRALPLVIESLKRIWAPLDLALYYEAFPKMKVFSILPRCVDQVGMSLNP